LEQKPETQENAVLQIIEKVDNKFEKRLRKIYFSRNTEFRYYLTFITLIFYLVLFLMICVLLGWIVKALPSVSQQPPSTQIAISISITAAFIALASFAVNIQKLIEPANMAEILFEYNYKVLKENVTKENAALLKGLVMLKSKHPELSLKQVLELPITKDKLFDMLYK
jgi:hypothetical protein